MADQLALWGAATDARINRIDFGAVPARSSGDVQVRVKNQSSQYTAHGVVVTVEDVDPAGAATQLLLSLDGRTFTASVSLGDLIPTATSTLIWLRRATASDAPTGLTQARLRAHASTWTPALAV